MSLILGIQVDDGVVLAADSATMVHNHDTVPPTLKYVFRNTEKIHRLHDEYPLGIAHCGASDLNGVAISNLVKSLKRRFEGKDHKDGWELNDRGFSLKKVADLVKEFFFQEKYSSLPAQKRTVEPLSLLLVGYEIENDRPDLYEIKIHNNEVQGPLLKTFPHKGKKCPIWMEGDTEGLDRLLWGRPKNLKDLLKSEYKLTDSVIDNKWNDFENELGECLACPCMPIPDAVELARFLMSTAIQYRQFMGSAPTITTPIDIAVITKYEGFRWAQKKPDM